MKDKSVKTVRRQERGQELALDIDCNWIDRYLGGKLRGSFPSLLCLWSGCWDSLVRVMWVGRYEIWNHHQNDGERELTGRMKINSREHGRPAYSGGHESVEVPYELSYMIFLHGCYQNVKAPKSYKYLCVMDLCQNEGSEARKRLMAWEMMKGLRNRILGSKRTNMIRCSSHIITGRTLIFQLDPVCFKDQPWSHWLNGSWQKSLELRREES